jgi:hypothetical protein
MFFEIIILISMGKGDVGSKTTYYWNFSLGLRQKENLGCPDSLTIYGNTLRPMSSVHGAYCTVQPVIVNFLVYLFKTVVYFITHILTLSVKLNTG